MFTNFLPGSQSINPKNETCGDLYFITDLSYMAYVCTVVALIHLLTRIQVCIIYQSRIITNARNCLVLTEADDHITYIELLIHVLLSYLRLMLVFFPSLLTYCS